MADMQNPPAARPEMREIATTADGRDITRGYVDALPLLPPQDTVLQLRGGGDYRTYEEVLRDEQVASTLQQRQLALISREWTVDPGGKMRRDKAAAEHLREILDHIAWDERTRKMLMGIFYGFAVAECLWVRDGRFITLDALKVRKQRRFGFAPDGELRLRTSTKPDGEALPARKFWCFSTGADNDDEPYGLGLAHWLYWPVLFKRNGIKFWLIFLEKFGQPTATGKYPPNATADERSKLLNALSAIQTDAGIIVPEGMMIELLEAARSGTADYTALYDKMNHAIAKTVLGQVMTSEAVGGQYKAEVQMDVRQDLVKADADLICMSFSRQVGRWLTDWNWPGAAYPKVWRDVSEPEDLKERAERDRAVHGMGFRPSLRYIQETYDGEWEERQQAPPTLPDPEAAPAPAFADADDVDEADVADDYTDRLERDSTVALDRMIDEIRKVVESADSMEDLQQRLLDAYSFMDPDELARVMQVGFAAADLAGRFEVSEGQ